MTFKKFTISKLVSVPYLSLRLGSPIFVKIDSEIQKELIENSKFDGKYRFFLNVTDLTTDLPMKILCNSVLISEFKKNYDNDSFINKMFQITKFKPDGKNYFTFFVAEITVAKEKVEPSEIEPTDEEAEYHTYGYEK